MTPDVPPIDPAGAPEPPRSSHRVGVIALALVGLVLTAGITYAASTVVSQPIGLTSEPATVGDSLAPSAPISTPATTSTAPATTTTVTTTFVAPPPAATTTAPTTSAPTTTSGGDDHHGGKDEDGDDD